MDGILKQAKLESQKIISWRREFHKIPELDLSLSNTSELVKKALDEMGIPYKTFPSHSGIVALIEGFDCTGLSKTVGLRADMDALPVRELAAVPYASQNDFMHACGHDGHMAMLLGAAKLLAQNRQDLYGRVKLIFQPGEELSGGAFRMIEEGVLLNPNVDVLFGQHVGMLSAELPAGHFGFYPGSFMASRDSFIINIKGKGCHGAVPAEGVDPVVISAQIITALQTLVSREINGTDQAVLTIGAIHGGETYNIIPETVTMKGAIRCMNEEQRMYFEKRIRGVCTGISEAMRGSCTIEYEHGYPVTNNDPKTTQFVIETAKELFGKEAVRILSKPLMGSEDMSFFLQKRPGCYWLLSTPPKDKEAYPNHSPYFEIDDEYLYLGAALMAQTAVKWLKLNRS